MGSRNARALKSIWQYFLDPLIPKSHQGRLLQCRQIHPLLRTYSAAQKPFQYSRIAIPPEQDNRTSQMEAGSSSTAIGPVKMKIDSPDFHSLFTPGLSTVSELFHRNGFQLCIAGGAVRDLMMGKKPKDVDFATTATPTEMHEILEKGEYRIFNLKGESHGTVSCKICDDTFEITTLRIDKTTDGRHAEVEFTRDWYLDANRRDLTINSMFLDLQGNVIDFFGGVEDLMNKRVRFVGSAVKRIQEDYLRILRFFRFYGRIAEEDTEFDDEAISAIVQEGKGLTSVSGPRIWKEMTQIFHGQHMAKVVRKMYECGILQYVGFPVTLDLDKFQRIYEKTKHLDVNHMTYVSTFLQTEEQLTLFDNRVGVTKKERKIALFIIKYRDEIDPADPNRLKFCQDILVDVGICAIFELCAYVGQNIHAFPFNHHYSLPIKDLFNQTRHVKIRAAQYRVTIKSVKFLQLPSHEGDQKHFLIEVLKYIGDFETIKHLHGWTLQRFPVNGKMLKDAGVPKGKTVGEVLKILRSKWKKSHFKLSCNELLEDVPKILESL